MGKMKQCYMIYTEAEGQKNHAFIELFRQTGEGQGLLFSFVPVSQYQQMPLPDLVLNRSRDPLVSRWYEDRQIQVFHDSDMVEIGNDKYKTLLRLQERLTRKDLLLLQSGGGHRGNWATDAENGCKAVDGGIKIGRENSESEDKGISSGWCPGSFLLTERMKKDFHFLQQQIEKRLGTVDVVVLKTVDGHGGSEVYRLSSNPLLDVLSWRQVLDSLQGRRLLCQEWVDCNCRDLRVYVLWGEIYAAVLRQGRDDFRSNYSRGGSIRPYDLSKEEQRYIETFIQALGGKRLAMAGIDFLIRRDGTLIFNELEEMAGCRMLYQCTEWDIVRDYIMGMV